MTELPLVSVVIPVWNSPDLIGKCLTALAQQTYPRDRFEVLVVDNGSTDATANVARSYPFVAVLSEPVAGSYRARNRGLRSARGEYVAFTDADCIPDPDWLTAAVRAARLYPQAGVLAGHGGPLAAGWTSDAVRELFRQGLCSLASQLIHATVRD